MLIVAGLLMSALHVTHAVALTRTRSDQRMVAVGLAHDLLAEALATAYVEPDAPPLFNSAGLLGSPSWGPDTGENASGNRAGFDDVDDFHGWSASPPENAAGQALADTAGLRRSVVVERARLDQPAQDASEDEGIKRVSVRVHAGQTLLAEAVGLATQPGRQEP